jgi:replication factor C large subunit
MIIEKYTPRTTREIAGNRKQVDEIKKWVTGWKKGALLLWGPPGCGKTLAVKLIAGELGYSLLESNASDVRDKHEMERIISSSKQSGVFGRKCIILVEDMEILESKIYVARLIKESRQPVIFVTENPYELGMASVVKGCKSVRFDKIDRLTMASHLKQICLKEGLKADVAAIVSSSEGDMRAALIDLEVNASLRERSSNIFDAVRGVFNGKRVDDIDAHSLMFWLSENIPNEFRRSDEIAAAYECLSKADLFMARIIRRQSWSMQKYVIDLFSGVAQARRTRKMLLTTYRPPTHRAGPNRRTLAKIGGMMHIASKKSNQYLPLMAALAEDEEFCNAMGFDEDDIEFLESDK